VLDYNLLSLLLGTYYRLVVKPFSRWRILMKRCLFLFVVSVVVTFVVSVTMKHVFAVPCTTGAQVCNFTISTGVLYNTICKNGVQSTSNMPEDDPVKCFVETSDPCGLQWYRNDLLDLTIPTGSTCGITVLPDCD
jgi:hypothetical protein